VCVVCARCADEVRIWNRVLYPAEINSMFTTAVFDETLMTLYLFVLVLVHPSVSVSVWL